jgi:hypothetical protein
MERMIVGYHQGDNHLWVAELSCGHDRPARRQPDPSALSEGAGNQSVVTSGQLDFRAAADPPLQTVVKAGRSQPIPPGVEHHVQPIGSVRFSIEFLAVEPAATVPAPTVRSGLQGAERYVTDHGGDPACWAGLLCEDCGVVLDGGGHRPGCGHAPHVS